MKSGIKLQLRTSVHQISALECENASNTIFSIELFKKDLYLEYVKISDSNKKAKNSIKNGQKPWKGTLQKII